MLPKLHFKWERWKYNKTFEVYVSSLGNVRNQSKAALAPKIDSNGYMRIYVGGSKPKYMLLHRLVMLTWKPTPEAEDLTVDHLNHNKRDNSLENLEWVTAKENTERAKKDYLPLSKTPSSSNKSKKIPDAIKITHAYSGDSITVSDPLFNAEHIRDTICANKSFILPVEFVEKTLKGMFRFKNGTTLIKKYGYTFQSLYYNRD